MHLLSLVGLVILSSEYMDAAAISSHISLKTDRSPEFDPDIWPCYSTVHHSFPRANAVSALLHIQQNSRTV
jgi:hypothetical protein